MKAQMADANIDDRMIARQEAIISSMTKAERKKPDLLNASRKKRVAAGAGVEVQEINRLLKQHRQMADMVKSLSRGGRGNMQKMAAMMGGLGMGGMPVMGGAPSMDRLKALGGGRMPEPSPEEMKALQDRLSGLGGGQLPGGLPGLPGLPKKPN
jgi:signal recognition particle subunit SRP54